jgi:REP element-mobilizing transposase RayT
MRFHISRDNPAFYLTAVTKDRLPIFRTAALAQLMCNALDEARCSGRFLILAYVIMVDHLHLVTDSKVDSKDILRFIKGIASRRIIDYLKANGQDESLEKLRVQHRSDGSDYSVWQRHPNVRLLWSEEMLWQRIQYTHLNPVRGGFVDLPNDWRWSSSRIWHGHRAEDEPLDVDREKIEWRR